MDRDGDGAAEVRSKAWVFTSRGDPSSIMSLTSRPMPASIPADHLLIRVAFAALNQGTLYQMALIPPSLRKAPNVPEMDLAGTVLQVGGDHSGEGREEQQQQLRLAPGDRVAAMIPASYALSTGEGALAEHVVVPSSCVVKVPVGVKLGDAAAVLLVGMTARQQVSEARIKSGDRVLVNAASGGIGSMVVQMARRIVGEEGAVIGICSGRNADMVKGLGARDVVDYTQHVPLPKHLAALYGDEPFDAVVDTIGHQSLYLSSPYYLVPTGIYSSVGIKPPAYSFLSFLGAVFQMKLNEWWPVSTVFGGVGRWWRGVSMMNPTRADRERVMAMLGGGEIRVVRDSVWEFEDARQAYGKLAEMRASGKILVRVDKDVSIDS